MSAAYPDLDTTADQERKLTDLLKPAALARLKRQLRELRTPVVHTPWTWADSGGLYWGTSGAWQYFQAPITAVADAAAGLDALLKDLARTAGTREVHALMYSWEEPAQAPADLPEAHRSYVQDSLRLLTPGQVLVVGVRVNADPAAEKQHTKLRSVFFEVVDRALGEWVPDLDAYTTDRRLLADVADRHGLTPLAGSAADVLEAWYTLGVPRDVELVERDDAILVRDTEVIEFVSVRSFADDVPHEVTGRLTPGSGGTLVVSVRGELVAPSRRDDGRDDRFGSLSQTSIVIGRRAKQPSSTLALACGPLVAVEVKPLPMRQLPALDETLPGSANAVDPHLFNVTAAKLRHVGFSEPIPAGDRSGYLAGMVTPDYAYPLYLDLHSKPGYTLAVAGDHGSGKTFLAEHLALQAAAAGRKVVIVRDGGDTGLPLLDADTVLVDRPVPGLLDPFATLGTALGPAVTTQVVKAALPQIDADGLALVESTLSRAAAADVTELAAALRLIPTPALAAQMIRFSKTPAGQLLTAAGDASPWSHPGVTILDVPGILTGVEDPQLRATLTDLLVAVAHAHNAEGLTVTDDSGQWHVGSIPRLVSGHLDSAHRRGPLVTLTSTPIGLLNGALPTPDTTVLLRSNPEDAAPVFATHAYAFTPAMRAWIHSCGPVLDDDTVEQPALGVIWDAHGRAASVSVTPVPLAHLPALTRGRAHTYLADIIHGH